MLWRQRLVHVGRSRGGVLVYFLQRGNSTTINTVAVVAIKCKMSSAFTHHTCHLNDITADVAVGGGGAPSLPRCRRCRRDGVGRWRSGRRPRGSHIQLTMLGCLWGVCDEKGCNVQRSVELFRHLSVINKKKFF
jgi:hypothetical protein